MSKYTNSLNFENIPQKVVHEVKRRVIDTLGCALGAYSSEPCRIAREIARSINSPAGATVLGTQHKTSLDMAAFTNGIMIRYLDFNDTYLSKEPCHPSDNISAALAVGESEHSSGKQFIESVVLAYEVICRLCDAASIRKRGWDHVTYGSFSSCLAAAKLMGLSVEKTIHAIALAGTPNIALRQTRVGELSMWKGCAFANAARNGVFAAILAKHGMTGPSPIFEGEKGFWKLVSGPFELEPFGGEGESFKILESSIKYFPAEYHSQGGIEAALELRKNISNMDDIKSINIETFDAAVEIIAGEKEKWNPSTRETADHSYPYLVAVALMDGTVGLSQFTHERITDPKLHELIQKVKASRNSDLTKEYPLAIPSIVKITTSKGKYAKKVTYPRGHAKNPMSDEEIEKKFRILTEKILPPQQISRILDKVWNLEKIKNIGEIISQLVVKRDT